MPRPWAAPRHGKSPAHRTRLGGLCARRLAGTSGPQGSRAGAGPGVQTVASAPCPPRYFERPGHVLEGALTSCLSEWGFRHAHSQCDAVEGVQQVLFRDLAKHAQLRPRSKTGWGNPQKHLRATHGYHCLIRAAWRTSSFVDVEIAKRTSAGTCAHLSAEPCPDRRWCVRESLGRIASGCASMDSIRSRPSSCCRAASDSPAVGTPAQPCLRKRGAWSLLDLLHHP